MVWPVQGKIDGRDAIKLTQLYIHPNKALASEHSLKFICNKPEYKLNYPR